MADEQPATKAPPAAPDAPESSETVDVTLTHGGAPHTLTLPAGATMADLAAAVEAELAIPAGNQKYLVAKLGLLKPPFAAPPAGPGAAALAGRRVTLVGTTASGVAAVAAASSATAAREAARARQRRAQPAAYATHAAATHEATYTFGAVRPLAGLPRPERSRAFLERLRADPGVVAAMRRHRFRVGLLTEMDPAAHTEATHEGTTRILGLNRNRGEVIELRLRTDAYDGYRDYKTIRNTLCHELAHNVHSDHDRQFWDLCHQIEREVAAADYNAHGRSLDGGDAAARPPPADEPAEEIAYDHGGWTGGAFVLGSGGGAGAGAGANSSSSPPSPGSAPAAAPAGGSGNGEPLTRREIMARAAEERMRRMTDEERRPPGGPGGRGSAS